MQPNFFFIQLKIILLDAGDLQHFFHLIIQARILLFNDAGVLHQARVVLDFFIIQKSIRRNANGADGRFKLVRHIVDEVLLHLRQPLLPQNNEHGIHEKQRGNQQNKSQKQRRAHIFQNPIAAIGEGHAEVIFKIFVVVNRQPFALDIGRIGVALVGNQLAPDHILIGTIIDAVLKFFRQSHRFHFSPEEKFQISGVDIVINIDDVIIGRDLIYQIVFRQIATEFLKFSRNIQKRDIHFFVKFRLFQIPNIRHPPGLRRDDAHNRKRTEKDKTNDGFVVHNV